MILGSSEDNSDNAPKDPKSGLLSGLIAKETVIVLILSGLAYLCAYYYKRSYLESFGIDRVYVSIDILYLVVASAAILTILGAFVQPLLIFPRALFRILSMFMLTSIELIFIGGLFAFLMVYVGVTWTTVVPFVLLEFIIF